MEPTVGLELWITMGVLGFFAAIFVAIFTIVFVNERGRGRVENELENHVRRFAELREALNDLNAEGKEQHRETNASIERLDAKIERIDAKIDRVREELDAKIDRVHRELDDKIEQNHREVMDSISELKTLMLQVLTSSRGPEASLTGDND